MQYYVYSSMNGRTHKIVGFLAGVKFTRVYNARSRDEAVHEFLANFSQ